MGWDLFCQIEVIILTVGLVVAFVSSMWLAGKDNSFFKRVAAIGKTINEMNKGERHDQ